MTDDDMRRYVRWMNMQGETVLFVYEALKYFWHLEMQQMDKLAEANICVYDCMRI
jgi:hypothetical protein